MNAKILFFLIAFTPLFSCNFISTDVDDFNFHLPKKEFTVNSEQFGLNWEGTFPTVECPANPCPDGENYFCDAGTCAAKAAYALQSSIVRLKDEVEELAVVGAQDQVTVKFKYIQMEVVSNTLNYAMPPLQLYVAPQTATNLFDEHGEVRTDVELIGSLPSIPASTGGIFDINLTTGGEAALTRYCQRPDVPFYFFIHGTTIFGAGDPVPRGAITVRIHSMATASIN
jgi:hypothetical protein